MSHSIKKNCGGAIVCYSLKANKLWKRHCNHSLRNKLKDVDFIPTNIHKESNDSWGPKDGTHLYWSRPPKDKEILEWYKKALRK